jgi:inorganic pyrophosphatase
MQVAFHEFKALFIASWVLFLSACSDNKPGASGYPAFGPEGVNMFVTTPTGLLPPGDTVWPAPGNWGFIPSTLSEDGQPLSCLMPGQPLPDEKVSGIIPVAAVQWREEEKLRTVVVGWPSSSGLGHDYLSFRTNHDPMRLALELWLKHVIAPQADEWVGWQNEVFAMKEIRRSAQRFNQIQTPTPHGD